MVKKQAKQQYVSYTAEDEYVNDFLQSQVNLPLVIMRGVSEMREVNVVLYEEIFPRLRHLQAQFEEAQAEGRVEDMDSVEAEVLKVLARASDLQNTSVEMAHMIAEKAYDVELKLNQDSDRLGIVLSPVNLGSGDKDKKDGGKDEVKNLKKMTKPAMFSRSSAVDSQLANVRRGQRKREFTEKRKEQTNVDKAITDVVRASRIPNKKPKLELIQARTALGHLSSSSRDMSGSDRVTCVLTKSSASGGAGSGSEGQRDAAKRPRGRKKKADFTADRRKTAANGNKSGGGGGSGTTSAKRPAAAQSTPSVAASKSPRGAGTSATDKGSSSASKKSTSTSAKKTTRQTSQGGGGAAASKQRRHVGGKPATVIPAEPDEPTYCVCNQISYGDMVGCDYDGCKLEWFHFGCVSLTNKPKGKWYCPDCRGDKATTCRFDNKK